MPSGCLFCKIIAGELPAKKVYEDDDMLAFHDIHPQAAVHFLIVPKLHIASMAELEEAHSALMGKMMVKAPVLARAEGSDDGFRTIINTGNVGKQDVYHLHIHILGGKEPLPLMITH